ncbi:hypothetical protein EVAR_83425_1 [Eumeta japonica]|uniref:Uncharacterized protein n=1 Tax=Eumeta variegata TaxID=151549 RepID=A0A4C1TYH2_EUMVA|nr:hypothetical protein EVAR_83425_1 [Eumeta japonica]
MTVARVERCRRAAGQLVSRPPLSICIKGLSVLMDAHCDPAQSRPLCCVRPLSLFYSDASVNGVEERSLVPRSRSHARFKQNATMSHAFLYCALLQCSGVAGTRNNRGKTGVRRYLNNSRVALAPPVALAIGIHN